MRVNSRVIFAIVKKDVLGLLPLVLLGCAVFFIVPVIASLDVAGIGGDTEFWVALQSNFYYFGYAIGILLMVSVLQLDPADSLNHDWLTRPVSRTDWIVAKLFFLIMVVVTPVVVSRFIVNLSNDFGFGLSLAYALGIEKLGAVLAVPLFFAVALLAPNLRKTILLITAVFMIILLPGWSVTRSLLLMLGINFLGIEYDGMMWLQGLPLIAAGVFGSLLIYWFLYCRRQRRWAYGVFWGITAVVFLTIFPPLPLYNWDRVIAIHETLINNSDTTLEDAVLLEQTQACFPAAIIGNESGFEQDDSLLVQAAWQEAQLESAGPGALTFATSLRYRDLLVDWFSPSSFHRELSVDWRVDRIRAQGSISAASLTEELSLQRSPTALNRYAPISHTETDYWLLPADVMTQLADDPSARLTLEYDLALLSPNSYELPTDGQRYEFPGLGSCKAEVDENANNIEIECLKRGVRPELVSAQLIGLDSSRVDSASRATFTGDWLEWFSRKRYELTLHSPNLVDSSTVMLTAYEAERVLNKQVVSNGVLGDKSSICPLPTDQQFAAVERSNWSDRSPHEISSIAVERNVRVEVLDWRGGETKEAPTLFLLPGLGASAHSYDEVAPMLAEKYNVLAMTRRGANGSSTPDHGYDPARLSQDVLAVLDTLGIESPVLVGHSIGGEELSYLGANYGERFSGLVYLDAAYDRTGPAAKRNRELSLSLPDVPPVRPSEAISYEALNQYALRIGRPRNIPEGELIASRDLATGAVTHEMLYLDAVMMNLQSPDYENISVPALGIYAVPSSPEALMEVWYDNDDPVVQETVIELFQEEVAQKQTAMDRFDNEIADSEVLALENANHWIFLSHEQEVIAAIEEFVEGL